MRLRVPLSNPKRMAPYGAAKIILLTPLSISLYQYQCKIAGAIPVQQRQKQAAMVEPSPGAT